jgi:intracellular multiplication protein IcmP
MLVFAGYIIWYFARVEILMVLRYLRLAELFIISLFTDRVNACYAWLKQAPILPANPTNEGLQDTSNCFGDLSVLPQGQTVLDYYSLTGISIGIIGHITAHYMRFPLAILFGFVAIYITFYSPRNQFRTRHTLETFIKAQVKMWPVISPIVNFKPASLSARIPGSTVPDKLPAFAEALSPEEWISFQRIPVTNGIPDREATRRAFIQQLGPRWQGIEGQPPYMRAFYAACALKGAQKREQSDELLGRLSLCWSLEKGFNMAPDVNAEVNKILGDKDLIGAANNIAAQHAYRTTAILGALKWARWMGGVLASAQFLWMRAVDRNLWYPLNNLGRRSFHVEGSGAIAHFMAEQNAKKPLPIPRVDTAIVALNQFLADPDKQSMPIPPREEAQPRK